MGEYNSLAQYFPGEPKVVHPGKSASALAGYIPKKGIRRGNLPQLSVPLTAGNTMMYSDKNRQSKSMQIDEAKAFTHRAIIKYNLASEEGNEYYQFIKLLATFESSIIQLKYIIGSMTPFLQESIRIAKVNTIYISK